MDLCTEQMLYNIAIELTHSLNKAGRPGQSYYTFIAIRGAFS